MCWFWKLTTISLKQLFVVLIILFLGFKETEKKKKKKKERDEDYFILVSWEWLGNYVVYLSAFFHQAILWSSDESRLLDIAHGFYYGTQHHTSFIASSSR